MIKLKYFEQTDNNLPQNKLPRESKNLSACKGPSGNVVCIFVAIVLAFVAETLPGSFSAYICTSMLSHVCLDFQRATPSQTESD